jgi:signal transduction histidine kinase
MNAAITLQVVIHAILWILIVSLEVVGAVLMAIHSDPIQAFVIAFFFTLIGFFCLLRLGNTALLRDLQELHLYDIFLQVLGLYSVWTGLDLQVFGILAGMVVFLKFFRLLWINPRLSFAANRGWPVFGVLGFYYRWQGYAVPVDWRALGLFPLALFLSCVFNFVGFLKAYVLIGAVTVLLINIFYHRIISFLYAAEQERIESGQKLAVAQATAAINAELSEKNAQLVEANRERDLMLADLTIRNECLRDASHDLAAPAFWITSCAQQLVAANDDAARKERALQLLDSVSHYNQLLQATIHSAKIMTKIEMPRPVAISVNKLADYLWDKYMRIFEEKGLRFSIYKANQYVLAADGSVSPDVMSERAALSFSVACDEQVLMRILNNLIMNALRNTDQGRVHIAFRKRAGQQCWIEVRDTGSGFEDAADSDWQANFNRVAQRIKGGKMRASEAASHGLGINNMKNLCTSIGSSMMLYSKPGQGSLFRFRIALAQAETVQPVEHQLVLAEEFE